MVNAQGTCKVWSPKEDWIAIETQTFTCLHIETINFFESGKMTREGPLGKVTAMCLVIHFKNGKQIGLPTDNPQSLLKKILDLM